MNYETRKRIAERYKSGEDLGVYFYNYVQHFTPIESLVWSDMRLMGILMWPEYPILNYFADFACPERKIIVECDGKQHEQNKEYDRKRDLALFNEGWVTYRIPGWQCFKTMDFEEADFQLSEGIICEDDYFHMRREYFTETSEGFIEALKHLCFCPISGTTDDDMKCMEETLEKHRFDYAEPDVI